jgi:Chlorophyll A-B binding protein
MLGILGLIVPDILGQNLYLLPDMASQRLVPFTIQLVVAVGALEAYRGTQRIESTDLDSRVYPGELFDVLGVTQKRNATAGKVDS